VSVVKVSIGEVITTLLEALGLVSVGSISFPAKLACYADTYIGDTGFYYRNVCRIHPARLYDQYIDDVLGFV